MNCTYLDATSTKFDSDFEPHDFSNLSSTILTIGLVTYEVCLNPLLVATILFEKFGVDSQRRTTINMLFSKMALALMINNIIPTPFAFYGLVIQPGGLNYWVGICVMMISYSSNYFAFICGVEILIFRILYVTKWSTFSLSDDNFFSMTLGWINTMMVIIFTSTRYLLGDIESMIFLRAMTGHTANRTTLQDISFFW